MNGHRVTVQGRVILDVQTKAFGSSGGGHILFQRNAVYNSSLWTAPARAAFQP